jgi:hypothetical protein
MAVRCRESATAWSSVPVLKSTQEDEVSTTCDSGWVQTHVEPMLLSDPPAIAGGTDLIQVGSSFRSESSYANITIFCGAAAALTAGDR